MMKTNGKSGRFTFGGCLLITVAIVSILATIIRFIWRSEVVLGVLVATVLPALLLFVALKFPTMIFSAAIAGIGTFFSVFNTLAFLSSSYHEWRASTSDSVIADPMFTIELIFIFICAAASAVGAIVWTRKLRKYELYGDDSGV